MRARFCLFDGLQRCGMGGKKARKADAEHAESRAESRHGRVDLGEDSLYEIARLVESAPRDAGAARELVKLKAAYARLEERDDSPDTRAHPLWPSIRSASFRDSIRRVRSLHVPLMLEGRTVLLTHQLVNRIYMGPSTEYNGVLLVHDTGSGKTCTSIAIAEQYMRTMRNRACVIGPPGVRGQFRSEIASTRFARYVPADPETGLGGHWELDAKSGDRGCGSNAYVNAARRVRDPDHGALEARMRELVDSRYEFMGFREVFTAWRGMDETRRIQTFSDRVIIIDEAHKLKSQGTNGRQTKKVTEAIHAMARTCFNVKFVLMTATPMFDRASEIIDLVNILRYNDDLPPLSARSVFPNGTDLDSAALSAGVQGYISAHKRILPDPRFPEQLDAVTARVRGVRTRWPKFRRDGSLAKGGGGASAMVHVPCSKHQASDTAPLVAPMDGIEVADNTQLSRAMQAANATFPGGLIGDVGLASVLDSRAGRYRPGHEGSFGPEKLACLSPKIAAIVDKIATCRGIAVVFTSFISAGVKIVAAALEERGFVPSRFDDWVFKGTSRKAPKSESPPRYAVLGKGSNIAGVLRLAKSSQNTNGEVLKVLLCTRVVFEGIDLANVREVHILDGWWNTSMESQIIGRAVRFESHATLPVEHRNVTVFRYGVVMPGDREGIDHEIARVAKSKRELIERVQTVLVDEAYDCVVAKRSAQMALSRAGDELRGPDRLVTSQGVVVKLTEDRVKAARDRIAKMCDSDALEVMDVDATGSGSSDVDASAMQEVIGVVRDVLGQQISPGDPVELDELVAFCAEAGVPADLAVRAVTEIVHNNLPLTFAHGSRLLTPLGESSYTVADPESSVHAVVHIRMVPASSSRDLARTRPGDWRLEKDALTAELREILDEEPDEEIVVDMLVDRVACARSEGDPEPDDDEWMNSVERAQVPTIASVAQVEAGRGLVFVAKKGAACTHMTRAAVRSVLDDAGIPAPRSDLNRGQVCMYAEYSLRAAGKVVRSFDRSSAAALTPRGG